MSFIEEESKRERELRQAVERAAETDKDIPSSLKSSSSRKSISAKEKSERARKDYEQKQKTLEYKRDRLEWQKERSKIKDKLRKKAEEEKRKKSEQTNVNLKTDIINDKDKDPTAYRKGISNLASYAGGILKVAAKSAKREYDKKRENKNSQKETESEKRSKKNFKRNINREFRKKRLAPSRIKGLLPSSTLGQTARKDPNIKKQEIERRGGSVSEQFSHWREEFLFELRNYRKNKKKSKGDSDYIVDIMKGKNKITIGPSIDESLIYERKRDSAANALLSLAFVANAAQSPRDLIRSGHIEGPGVQLMSTMMKKRKEANRNLDSGRVSHPARNKKIKEDLLRNIIFNLIEAKYNKSNLKCNKPKSDPVGNNQTGKSHVVKACEGGVEKLIRFGQKGVSGSPKKKGESKEWADRRKRFKARHAKNIKKGKMSASWWANSVKW